MKVDANNLRRQACFAYNRLARTLNSKIKNGWHNDFIEVDVDEIEQDMEDLRQMVFAIAYCYLENDPEFVDLANEVGDPVFFNQQEE